MALLTIFKPFVAIGLVWGYASHRTRVVSLIPFNDAMVGESLRAMLFGYGGNFIFFVPFGLLVYALLQGPVRAGGGLGRAGLGGRDRLLRRSSFPLLKTTLVGAGVSIAIEITQYIFWLGYTDIDDVTFNTLGAFVGALMAKAAGSRAYGLWVALAIAVAVVFLALVILGPRI
ncbi:VanZ family protein [Corynebacterium callunae]|uniref:VanZ family protein n=1 Tax=Corynebacterium callunae TaxID=1721 RepID=UPI003982B413